MNIELKPEHEQILAQAVQSGMFETAQDVMDGAFQLIREQIEESSWSAELSDADASKLANGLAQARRGELLDPDVVLAQLRNERASHTAK